MRDDIRPDRHRVGHAVLRGVRLGFVDEGRGAALLLIHGWPETMRIWWRNVAPLAAAGFRVIAPDLRGFGTSDVAPDGFHDVPSHSRDLAALLDHLGIERVVLVGGDLGGAVLQDFALRFPARVSRIVVFNSPLPFLKEAMAGMRTRPAREASDYFLRQGNDADALAQELATPEQRRRYIAAFYGSRFWAHPGAFDADAVAFMTEPFADGAKLRASFGGYESSFHERARSEPALRGTISHEALILHGPSDHVIYPEFDRMAAIVFPNHVGPFLVRDAGHFLQWEAAHALNSAVRAFCRDLATP
jgi:pimeloyl-ACP methyl ester carboxylesterase